MRYKGDDLTEKIPSFVLYADYRIYFKKLSVKDKATLIDAIFDYAIEGVLPDKLSAKADMAFTIIRSRLDRDMAKYIERRDTNRRNGALGGRPKKSEKPEETHGFSEKTDETLNINTNTDTNTNFDITTTTTTTTDNAAQGGGCGGGVTESDFMSFWREYPKHMDRNEARTAFFQAVHTREELSELLSLLERWKNSEAWKTENGKYINRAARFLTDFFPTRDEPPSCDNGSFDTDEFFEAALARSLRECSPLD